MLHIQLCLSRYHLCFSIQVLTSRYKQLPSWRAFSKPVFAVGYKVTMTFFDYLWVCQERACRIFKLISYSVKVVLSIIQMAESAHGKKV